MVLTFDELRKVKDSLPHGSIEKIANELHVEVQTVRNYFGSDHFSEETFVGAYYEKGAHGGYVRLDDEKIFETAMRLIHKLE